MQCERSLGESEPPCAAHVVLPDLFDSLRCGGLLPSLTGLLKSHTGHFQGMSNLLEIKERDWHRSGGSVTGERRTKAARVPLNASHLLNPTSPWSTLEETGHKRRASENLCPRTPSCRIRYYLGVVPNALFPRPRHMDTGHRGTYLRACCLRATTPPSW